MLRRRKKDARRPRTEPRDTGSPGSRRRARADAPVPEALRIGGDAVFPPDAGEGARTRQRRKPQSVPRAVALVTGFEPFGGESSNPSWEVARQLAGRTIAGLRVEACRVPCEFRRSIEVVAAAIAGHRPAVVLCLGQAGGRAHLGIERVAINVDDARIPDNAGRRPIDEPIAASGPPAYFATVPVKAMAAAMRAANVPAEVSNSAGTYVCNHLMYGVLHHVAASGGAARAGFIHLPYAEEQVLEKPGAPALAVATMVRGVEAALAAAAHTGADLQVSEGALD